MGAPAATGFIRPVQRILSILGWLALILLSTYITVVNVSAWTWFTNNQAQGGSAYWGEAARDAGMALVSLAAVIASYAIARRRRLTGIRRVGSAMGWALIIEVPLLIFAMIVAGPF